MEERTIKVTGSGGIHVVPDVTRLKLSLASLHDTYEDAYTQATENTQSLARIMNETGLATTLPKTIRLDIDKEIRAEYDKYNHHIGDKFIGFRLDHRVKIDLGIDNELLSKVVKLIGQRLKQAEIEIGYTVRDPRPHQLRMLERAVKDAKEKAEIMAKAGGCTLGDVKKVDYSWKKVEIYSQARMIHDAEEACLCNPNSLDITPDDWAASEDVSVEWQLV